MVKRYKNNLKEETRLMNEKELAGEYCI